MWSESLFFITFHIIKHKFPKAWGSQASARERAVTYGAARGYNTCNTSHLYLWIITAALKNVKDFSLRKQGETILPEVHLINWPEDVNVWG